MKKIMIGMLVGMVTATAICTAGNTRSIKRTKRAIVNKIEDLID